MSGYTPLFSSIITSSIWQEATSTRIVWVTMLAISDSNGIVEASIPGLANVARVTVEECMEALKVLSSPDPYSRTKDSEGRRIHEIDGGWQINNYKKFRDKAKSRAEYYQQWRESKRGGNVAQQEEKKRKVAKEKNLNLNLNNKTKPNTPETPLQQVNSCATVAQQTLTEPLHNSLITLNNGLGGHTVDEILHPLNYVRTPKEQAVYDSFKREAEKMRQEEMENGK